MDKHFLDVPGPDIVIERQWNPYAEVGTHEYNVGLVKANIPRTVVFHCPDGFAYGQAHAGTYDLGLNILQSFLPGREVEGLAGTRASRGAVLLHNAFANEFLRPPATAGKGALEGPLTERFTLKVADIKAWMRGELKMRPPHLRRFFLGELDGYTDASEVTTANGGSLKSVFLVNKRDGALLKFGEAEGIFVSFHSAEEDLPFVHKDFEGILNKRLRITIEEVFDGYDG
jgi:hypothetical protein